MWIFFPLTFENVGIVITIASTLAPLLARHTHWSTQVMVNLIVVCIHIYTCKFVYYYINIYICIYLYGICTAARAAHALEHPGDVCIK